jgi:hypothetical protein
VNGKCTTEGRGSVRKRQDLRTLTPGGTGIKVSEYEQVREDDDLSERPSDLIQCLDRFDLACGSHNIETGERYCGRCPGWLGK